MRGTSSSAPGPPAAASQPASRRPGPLRSNTRMGMAMSESTKRYRMNQRCVGDQFIPP
jgi:hypothetical protein